MINFLKILGLVIIFIGLILIFDARKIVKKEFNFGNQNETTDGTKILGTIICIIGGIITYFSFM